MQCHQLRSTRKRPVLALRRSGIGRSVMIGRIMSAPAASIASAPAERGSTRGMVPSPSAASPVPTQMWGSRECSPGADMAGASTVPVQMWRRRAQAWRRCVRGEHSPWADVGCAVPMQMRQRAHSVRAGENADHQAAARMAPFLDIAHLRHPRCRNDPPIATCCKRSATRCNAAQHAATMQYNTVRRDAT